MFVANDQRAPVGGEADVHVYLSLVACCLLFVVWSPRRITASDFTRSNHMELTISGKHSTFRTVPAFWIIAAFICFKHENVQPPNKIARKVTITALSNLANMQMSGEKLMKIVVTASWKHFEIVVFFLSIRLLHMHFWAQFYHTRSFSVHFHSTIFGGSASVGYTLHQQGTQHTCRTNFSNMCYSD